MCPNNYKMLQIIAKCKNKINEDTFHWYKDNNDIKHNIKNENGNENNVIVGVMDDD